MGRKRDGVVTMVFLVLIVADVSSASRLSGFRKRLAGVATPQASGGAPVSPSPTPNPVVVDKDKAANNNTSSNNATAVVNPAKASPVTPTTADNSTTKAPVTPKQSANPAPVVANATEKLAPPPQSSQGAVEGGKKDGGKKEDPNKTVPQQQQQVEGGENCTGLPRRCTDQNSLVACLLRFDEGSRRYVVLVQNNGEQNLTVDLSAPNSLDDASIQISKHGSMKVNLQAGQSDQVTLNAGNGECVLHMDPGSAQSQGGNFVFRLPSYDKLLTPVNGAYLLIISVVLLGGMWGCCCLFRKGRVAQGDVPYQELEMAAPNNELPNDLEAAEGWDDGWDDDWNDDNSVMSPAAHAPGSISANGLTARSSTNRDSWDNNWDD